VKSLAERGHSRHRKVKTLINTINALFLKKLQESELEANIAQMRKQELIVVDSEKVSYRPPIS